MRVTCERTRLSNGFAIAATGAPKSSPKPILRNIKIVAEKHPDGDRLILSATDMEIGIQVEVTGVEIEKPGEILASASLLGSILRESSDDYLVIESTDGKTVVKGARTEYKLQSENAAEFPYVAGWSGVKYHELPAALFKAMLQRTVFASDTESSRYALGGVLLEFGENSLIAVATDGRRLAKMEGVASAVGEGGGSSMMTIVPSRAVAMLLRAIGHKSGNVLVAASDNEVTVKCGGTIVRSRLIEGRFPKWRDVIPGSRGGSQVEMAAGVLHSAIRQAAIVSTDESRGLDFEFADGTLSLSMSTSEVGASRVETPIAFDAEKIGITLDHRYAADFLKVLSATEVVTLDVVDHESAAVFSTSDGYQNVVMPLASER